MKTVLLTLLIFGIVQIGYLYFWPTDSTDISKWKRSGLSVYTDNATGIQYVKTGFFGQITPRLNSDGSLFNVKD